MQNARACVQCGEPLKGRPRSERWCAGPCFRTWWLARNQWYEYPLVPDEVKRQSGEYNPLHGTVINSERFTGMGKVMTGERENRSQDVLRCRSCRGSAEPMTRIYRKDGNGYLVPVAGVCAKCCRPAAPVRPLRVTADRVEFCTVCRRKIRAGETALRKDGEYWHEECKLGNSSVI